MSSETVAVPRTLLNALVALVVLGLVAIGFLLGRNAGPEAPPPSRSESVSVTFSPRPLEPPLERSRPAPRVVPTEPARPPLEPAHPVVPAEPPPPPVVDPVLRGQVADYFQAMEGYLTVAAAWNNADTVTEAVVMQAAQGNSQGLKRILLENRQALQGIQSVEPPGPCERHHLLAQQVLESATRVVSRLGAATLIPVTDTRNDMTPELQALVDQVDELRTEGQRVRGEFGIPGPGPAGE